MKGQKLIAYCLTENLSKMTKEDIEKLDIIHIAFGLIENGCVVWKRENTSEQLRRIKEINPSVRIVLAIGGWAADGFSQAAYGEEERRKFSASAIELVKEEGLDGIDIDWEYPCIDDGGIQALPEDKENFTKLLAQLRKDLDALEGEKTLSIAAGALPSYIESTNMGEVAPYLDYVQLMTYDFHCGFSKITGHLANLYASKTEPEAPNAHAAVEMFVRAGVPIEKIVMGATFYGRVWDVSDDKNSGLGQPIKADTENFLGYDEIEKLRTSYSYFWDEDAKASYLFNGKTFITYEDTKALLHKTEYVNTNKMYGLMYWEYGQDETHTLTGYLYELLTRE